MKKYLCGALIAIIFMLFAGGVFAQAQDLERIISFGSVIQVHEDSSMTVTETIKVQAMGLNIKRGIYRDFPTRYKDLLGNRYTVEFEVMQILKNGQREDFHIERMSNGKRVYIGNKDVFLTPGEYTYIIVYKTDRQLGFFKDFDQLYWNVTGNGWAFTIDKATAIVQLPADASSKLLDVDAFTGGFGSRTKNVAVSKDVSGNIVFQTTKPLSAEQGLTIVVDWPKGYVQQPTSKMRFEYFLRDYFGLFLGLIAVLILLIYYLIMWAFFGKDPAKGTIIPLYNPPDKLSPAAVRFIMRMGFDHKTFAAAIMNMAVKGYLTIHQTDDEYTLKKTGKDESILVKHEKTVANKLFGSKDEIKLENKNHKKIKGAMTKLEDALEKNFEKTYFFTNSQYFIPGVIFSVIILIISAVFEAKENFPVAIFMCVWLTGWSFGVMTLLNQVIILWKKLIFSTGEKIALLPQAVFLSLFSIPFIIGECFGIALLFTVTSISVVILLVFLILINWIFYRLLKAPTLAGRKIMDNIEGFTMYLRVAEKDRLNLLNPPEKTPELFEKYLPYALALDVENQWSEQFSDVFITSDEDRVGYAPGWYYGPSAHYTNLGDFSSGFSRSFSSAISSSSTAPGSSSGSGGGGFSGGGGGGGGGGGW